ncbi:MAG TPA: DUF4214 domain-containing protein [Telluria sp.]
MYEENSGGLTTALKEASAAVFTDEMIEQILSLSTSNGDTAVALEEIEVAAGGEVTVAAGTEVAYVTAPANGPITLGDVPVVLFQGTTGVDATFQGTGASDNAGIVGRVVVGTAGSDNIVIRDALNSQIAIGEGDTVVTGAGWDTVVAGMGDSTVMGGEGYAIVQLGGNRSDYVVTVGDNGEAIVTGGGSSTTITGIQYVALDGGDALILAKDEVEAAVSTLYETTFGRAADAYGLEFWFRMARNGVSLNDIAESFVNSAEYADVVGDITDSTFVNNLFKQTYGHDASAEDLVAYQAKLDAGSSRADLIEEFAAAAGELIADGSGAEVVGSVTIIPGTFD